jgi:hypothetical protein
LVELDHNDDLTPDCLEKIIHAFQQHPECGFAFGDCSEVHMEKNKLIGMVGIVDLDIINFIEFGSVR